MIFWQQLRTLFLAATFFGLLSILGKSVSDPTLGKPTAYNFPTIVPLPGWQTQTSIPTLTKTTKKEQLFSKSKDYRYSQKKDYQLAVHMQYVVGTSGDAQLFIKNSTDIPVHTNQLAIATRHQDKIGFYQLFTYQNQAHLISCINPQGESTVTKKQFFDNRNTYDLQPKNIGLWLAGQKDLRDRRCLWSHLSMPLERTTTKEAYHQLEKTWFALYQWWSPRFPPL
jgi:cyanosortase A-associated protein